MKDSISIQFEQFPLTQFLCELEMMDPEQIAVLDKVSELTTADQRISYVERMLIECEKDQ